MPRRKKKPGFVPLSVALLLATGAALLFLGGELWKLGRSDSGRILLAARFGLGDPARVTQIVGREIRLNGNVHVVAGVLPADFAFLRNDIDVWLPTQFTAKEKSDAKRSRPRDRGGSASAASA